MQINFGVAMSEASGMPTKIHLFATTFACFSQDFHHRIAEREAAQLFFRH